jgi:hypothetical protein
MEKKKKNKPTEEKSENGYETWNIQNNRKKKRRKKLNSLLLLYILLCSY